jgi:DNA-binding CsgD family transcriptional regulator
VDELPPSLARLADIHDARLTHRYWRHNTTGLFTMLDRIAASGGAPEPGLPQAGSALRQWYLEQYERRERDENAGRAAIASAWVERIRQQTENAEVDAALKRVKDDLVRLTPREREVLRLVATGLSENAIAGRLALRETTVKRYVDSLLRKLRLSSRTALSAFAARSSP